jgi:hypothetical protein
MKSNLDLITVDSITIPRVVKILDQFGCCVINNYLSDEELNKLKSEFNHIFLDSKNNNTFVINNHPTNVNGKYVVCKKNQLNEHYKTIKTIFTSNFMKKTADKYFERDNHLNDEIFLTHEQASKTEILPWHFDRRHALKFYVNLVDVDEKHGAFAYDIGSHREGHFRANYYMLSGSKVGEMPNDIPLKEVRNPTTISTKAGALVIFDTDGFHKEGLLTVGERKIIRGHTHSKPIVMYRAKLFDAHWWLQSPLNLVKYLYSKVSRSIPHKRLTKSNRRKK